MASDKQKRKAAKKAKPAAPQPGPFRHPDGDRRRRGGPAYRDGVAAKELLKKIGAVELPDDDGDEPDNPTTPTGGA
jgi:hypothetical protein